MPKRKALEQEPGTGNVFADPGLADAGEHPIKAGLVVRIDRAIRQRKLTQAAAAALMGIDQAKGFSYARRSASRRSMLPAKAPVVFRPCGRPVAADPL
jgi:predicted XRE-type DNA-binding protein